MTNTIQTRADGARTDAKSGAWKTALLEALLIVEPWHHMRLQPVSGALWLPKT
jgi:hypothetical protein